MLFPTLIFAVFFIIVFTLHWVLVGRAHIWKPFMLSTRYVFYGWWDWRFWIGRPNALAVGINPAPSGVHLGPTPRRTGLAPRCAAFALVTACLLSSTGGASAAGLRIVTSFYPIYLATLNVARDIPGIEVINLTRPLTGCLHDYQMTPDDLVSLSKADIFVVNGAGMETFLDKAIQQVPRLKLIQASEGIALMSTAGVVNPHVWVSVTAHMQQVENIAAGLARFDPDHATLYRKNAAAYLDKLGTLRATMRAGLQSVKTRKIITFHEAFPYFAREFGLTVVAVIEREPGSEPNASELAQAITLVKKIGVKAILAEPQYSAKAADAIARETGTTVYRLDPVVTGPMAPDAYLTIMQANLQTLEQALGK